MKGELVRETKKPFHEEAQNKLHLVAFFFIPAD